MSVFDAMFAESDDPWGFTTRWYEERKRAITLASLPRARFASALELGCSIGVLTKQLAGRADRVVAVDASPVALEHARFRLAHLGNVELRQTDLRHDWPRGSFELVLMSEIGYFCTALELEHIVDSSTTSLTPHGVLVACHWRHPMAGWPLDGDDVHQMLRGHPGLSLLAGHTEEDFQLDVFSHPPAISVARAEGLL